jgi:hypothetical protein
MRIHVCARLGNIAGVSDCIASGVDLEAIEKIETTGDKLGWLDSHRAYYREPQQIYITGGKVTVMGENGKERIENRRNYLLDLTSLNWICLDSQPSF